MTLVATVEAMEAALGRGDWTGAEAFLAPDVAYRVGARPVVRGIGGIRAYMEAQAALLRWTGHETHLATETEDVALIEVTSIFERVADGATLRLPCTDIYRFGGGRIVDWRVYADLAAVGLDAIAAP